MIRRIAATALTAAMAAALTALPAEAACPHCPARLYMPGAALDHLISIHGLTEVEAWTLMHEGSKR